MRKRMLSLMLILILMSSFSLSVSAHEVPDHNRKGSISITMTYQNKPVSGGTLTIYRVADVVSDNGDYVFSYTDAFDECSIPVTKLNSADLPKELASIAKANKLTGTTQTLSRTGKAKFSDLEIGLYLVVQEKAASGYKKINPFLVSVPSNDNGHYIYDVVTAPKNLPGPEPSPTPSPDPKLPQTGQTNWPVPVMAVAGTLLVVAGLCLTVSAKKKNDET